MINFGLIAWLNNFQTFFENTRRRPLKLPLLLLLLLLRPKISGLLNLNILNIAHSFFKFISASSVEVDFGHITAQLQTIGLLLLAAIVVIWHTFNHMNGILLNRRNDRIIRNILQTWHMIIISTSSSLFPLLLLPISGDHGPRHRIGCMIVPPTTCWLQHKLLGTPRSPSFTEWVAPLVYLNLGWRQIWHPTDRFNRSYLTLLLCNRKRLLISFKLQMPYKLEGWRWPFGPLLIRLILRQAIGPIIILLKMSLFKSGISLNTILFLQTFPNFLRLLNIEWYFLGGRLLRNHLLFTNLHKALRFLVRNLWNTLGRRLESLMWRLHRLVHQWRIA